MSNDAVALAVDVGYGATKALSSASPRVLIPSAACPAPPDLLAGALGGPGPGHRVGLRRIGGPREEYLVGEAALVSLRGETTLRREKPPELHDTLLLTTAYLAGAGGVGSYPGAHAPALAVGLPLAFYRGQKNALRRRLEGLGAWVSVDGGEERWITFSRVVVVPQGAGVVLAHPELEDGLYGVVDVGEYTSDYLLLTVRDGVPSPVLEGCGSAEAGAYLVKQAVAQAFQTAAGEPLPPPELPRVTEAALAGRPVGFRGRELDLAPAAARAVQDAARLIASRVLGSWGPRAEFTGRVFLAGGGALLFGQELAAYFPQAETVEDPIFANCRGYLVALY